MITLLQTVQSVSPVSYTHLDVYKRQEYQVYESDEINYIDDHMKMRYGKIEKVDQEDPGKEK